MGLRSRSNDGQMILGVGLGFSRKRVGKNGKYRYTAYYPDIQGRERSAGTFPSRKLAELAWQKAESGHLIVGGGRRPRGGAPGARASAAARVRPHPRNGAAPPPVLHLHALPARDAVLRAD